jgi:hypothetical protein
MELLVAVAAAGAAAVEVTFGVRFLGFLSFAVAAVAVVEQELQTPPLVVGL